MINFLYRCGVGCENVGAWQRRLTARTFTGILCFLTERGHLDLDQGYTS